MTSIINLGISSFETFAPPPEGVRNFCIIKAIPRSITNPAISVGRNFACAKILPTVLETDIGFLLIFRAKLKNQHPITITTNGSISRVYCVFFMGRSLRFGDLINIEEAKQRPPLKRKECFFYLDGNGFATASSASSSL